MIKSTHPDLERLAGGGSVPVSPDLIAFLEEAGVPFEHGSALVSLSPGLELLDAEQIYRQLSQSLDQDLSENFTLEIHRVIGSTNDVALRRLVEQPDRAFICTAEMQTAGRGRRGRHWVSPFGKNIYLSYGTSFDLDLAELGGLSIVVGMQVVDALREMGLIQVGLKWPNDILLDNGKLGGILVELKRLPGNRVGVVAGVGINLSISTHEARQIDQPWSAAEGYQKISRNALLVSMSSRMISAFEVFKNEGFAAFMPYWSSYNLFSGSPISVFRGEAVFEGLDAGIDAEGNLLVATPSGVQAHNSGEVSMRAKR